MTSHFATPQTRQLVIDGRRVRLLDSGSARPAVLLLASPLINAELYQPTLQALARQWRVLVAELPGSGHASEARRPLTIPELADMVPPLLDALALPTAQLIGHSSSGVVALEAARRHPQRIERLVLVDAVGAHPGHALLPIVAGRLRDGLQEWRLSLRGWPAMLNNLLRHQENFLAQVAWSAGDFGLAAAREVRCPVLLAWGARDRTMPLSAARRYLDAFTQARLVISPQGSHDWLIERADEFAAVLAEPAAAAYAEAGLPPRPKVRLPWLAGCNGAA